MAITERKWQEALRAATAEASTEHRKPTRADRANIRHAFAALTDRGIHRNLARCILQDLLAEVECELRSEEMARHTLTPTAPKREVVDHTIPNLDEVDAVRHMLNRALTAYNGGKRYDLGATIGTDKAVKAINRSAVARRVKFKGEGRAKISVIDITKSRAPGKAERSTFTVSATLTVGDRIRALSAVVIETPKGLRISEWDPMHG
ncbi:hypothetical protein GS921_24290 [Rhodococcus hoagii]|nr:hypothetical protein [Prescottella equi]NKV32828.1 hypothetical protein [Prescottella equi]